MNRKGRQYKATKVFLSSATEMLKMVWLFHFFLLCLLGLTGAGQESTELLNLYETSSPKVLQTMSHSSLPVAVSVSVKDLNEVSSGVLMAESWLRTYVLAHYPAAKITTIVVGNNLLCQKGQEHKSGLVLPSLKNIYHSLTRWGLEKDIKVSPAFSSDCLSPDSAVFRDDLGEGVIKPLIQFLQTINSSYSIIPPPKFSPFSDKNNKFVSSHLGSIRKLGFLTRSKFNVLIQDPKETKSRSRKLSDIDSKVIHPYPARPTPLPEISPLHSSIGYSIPAHVAKTPQPPLSHSTSPPPLSFPVEAPPPLPFPSAAPPPFSFPEDSPPPLTFPEDSPPPMSFPSNSPPPMSFPSNSPPPMSFPSYSPPPMFPESPELPPGSLPAAPPPYGFSLPPCNPVDNNVAPSPAAAGVVQEVWCVAKPSVPAETLQQAMDYACGEGGADCEEIMPHGSCFYPDTVVAHASYAFNSYWQKTKRNGGTCSFGGTAMIINADPSYLHCRFVLS